MRAGILATQRVNIPRTPVGEERKTTPNRAQRRLRKILLARKSQGTRPWARPTGLGVSPGKRGQDHPDKRPLCSLPGRTEPSPRLRPVRPPPLADPALRPAADLRVAPMQSLAHIFRGTFVHSTWTSPMEVLQDHLLGVSDSGKIVFLEEASQQEKLAKEWCFKPCEVRELSQHEFFMPGLIDTHIHAPQYYFAGSNVDLPLMEWLTKYTFPVEYRFQSMDFAEEVYTRVVRRTLKNGTTTACYFGTIHTNSSLLLAEITDKFGQRAFVGKVCMDLNDTVPKYKETTEDSIKETERFVSEMLQKNYIRVKPIVTPRFSLSCTETLLAELGNIAKTHDLHIQSHISENSDEVNAVKTLYPSYKNYTDVYDKNNLLTNKTVMAHGCYLSAEELDVFRERGASISHCPNSNLSISSGFLNVQEVLKHEVKIGLGTDVAGGYSSSMLDAIRKAVMVSNILLINKINEKSLTLKEVFRLATLGGSQALGLDREIGNFEVGKEFDALLINPKASDSPIDLFCGDFVGDISDAVIQKFLYLGDDRNIEEVYVSGKQVVPFSSSV